MHEFALPLRVYIEDTDSGGIVYYVNYLKFMERARTEYFRALAGNKPPNQWLGSDLCFVVHTAEIHYRHPARLDDELQATARLQARRAASLTFAQTIARSGMVLACATIKIACVDRTKMRPRPIPPALAAQLPL
ncbi:MAG: tol-pal system-associated acyl-CoA thioesterase [Cellvibrionales bacterium]|nr:tol-pal system-associated acyl-CoA thioesterase [Cellvibrionales bacterium]